MSQVKLNFKGSGDASPRDYVLYCQSVQVGWKNNTEAKPKANGGSVVEVQTMSFDNPLYTLQGVHLTNEMIETSTNMTYSDLLYLSKMKYDGSTDTTIKLTVDYNVTSSTESLVGSDGNSPIKVVLENFSFSLSSGETYSDGSNRFHVPKGTIVFKETA